MSQAAGILFSDGKHILLLKRGHQKEEHAPRTWCVPGGGAEKGERPIEAALREFREETGVYRAPGKRLEAIRSKSGNVDFTCFIYEVKDLFKVRKLSREHTQWKWVPITNLHKFKLMPEFKQQLPKYLRAVKRRIKPSFKEWLDLSLAIRSDWMLSEMFFPLSVRG